MKFKHWVWVICQEATLAKTRTSGSQCCLLPTVPWNRRKSKRSTKERKKIGNRKLSLMKTSFVSVLKLVLTNMWVTFTQRKGIFISFLFNLFYTAKKILMSLEVCVALKASLVFFPILGFCNCLSQRWQLSCLQQHFYMVFSFLL